MQERNLSIGVVKFDCLSTDDDKLYEKMGVAVKKGLSGRLCPDHYFVSNIEEVVKWGVKNEFDILITESAGLCNRWQSVYQRCKSHLCYRQPQRHQYPKKNWPYA
ncbi:MAG: hypothetical protein U5L09_20745 [Bacteroidales bacterium]|nr:hypothetical protein [Bacteroidales bacterium]